MLTFIISFVVGVMLLVVIFGVVSFIEFLFNNWVEVIGILLAVLITTGIGYTIVYLTDLIK